MKKIVISSVVGFLIFATGFSASAQNSSNIPSIDLEKILILIEEKKCKNAWDTIWDSARNGSGEAYALLAQALYSGSIFPPSISNDRSKIMRDLIFFSLNALSYSSEENLKYINFPAFSDIKNVLMNDYFSYHGDEYFLNGCERVDGGWKYCLDRAIASKFIPTKDQFLQEVEAADRLGITATCFVIGHSNLDLEPSPLGDFEKKDGGSNDK